MKAYLESAMLQQNNCTRKNALCDVLILRDLVYVLYYQSKQSTISRLSGQIPRVWVGKLWLEHGSPVFVVGSSSVACWPFFIGEQAKMVARCLCSRL